MMRIVTGDEIRIETEHGSADVRFYVNDEEVVGVKQASIHYLKGTPLKMIMTVEEHPNPPQQVRAFLVEGNDMLDFEKWLKERGR